MQLNRLSQDARAAKVDKTGLSRREGVNNPLYTYIDR